jgi:anaerobic selenocysteine-containing dehydrogenase
MSVTTHKTFCRICHAYCAIEVDVEDGKPVAVRGDTDDPVYGGYTCIKGRQLPEQYVTPARISKSLKRRPDGDFEEIDTARAFDEIADKVRQLIEDHGPRSIATYVGSYGYQNSAALVIPKAWHKSIESPSYYTSVTIDQPARHIAMSRLGAWGGGTHKFTDADVCMMIGNNPVVSQFTPFGGPPPFSPYARLRDEIKKGMKVIVVDPRRTEVANRATHFLQVNPGEDVVFLSGFIRQILKEGLHDEEFCAHHMEGLEELIESVEPYTPEFVASRCDINVNDFLEAVSVFGNAKKGVVVGGTGPNMAPHGVLIEHLIQSLNFICGRVNREGEQVPNPGMISPPIPRHADVHAASPAWGNGPKSRVRGLGEIFGEMPTAALNDEILLDGEGQVKALFCLGGNPMVAFPDQDKTKEALEKLELLVCVDLYKSATAKLADYIIAPTISLERDDMTILTDSWYDVPYAHYTKAVLPRNDQSREEWEIYWELSHRLGIPIDLPGGPLDPEVRPSKYDALKLCTAGSRIPIDEMRDKGRGHLYEEVDVRVEPGRKDRTARFQLMPEGVADEMAEVYGENHRQDGKILDDGQEFTHLLISRRLKHVFNSSGQQLTNLQKKGTTNPAYMNPADLTELGISSGELIEIKGAYGMLVGVAEAANDVKRGVISMAHAWGDIPGNWGDVREKGASTNRLIDDHKTYDRITGQPRMTAIPVNLRHVPEDAA